MSSARLLKKLNRTSAGIVQSRPVKVLQFGEGNFLRAFADWTIDLLNEKTDFNAAVEIVQPLASGLAGKLHNQGGLYHVVLNGIQQGLTVSQTRLITCVSDAFNPYDDFERLISAGKNPDLKFIVSNTTEAGISFNSHDSNLNRLAEGFPGKVAQILYARYLFFNGSRDSGLIFLPCELIERNGEKLKEAILQYIDLWKLSTSFSSWVEHANIFCNTLVDRIVPGFPKDSIQQIQQSTGYEDELVVAAEPFMLWVIEGPPSVQKDFPAALAGLPVKFVNDLTPYRTRKVRILNGAHTALVPVAWLRGLRTVRESVEDHHTGKFIRHVIFNEIIPSLDLPDDELRQFANDVMERFRNPFIHHELSAIALNSISKFKVRVLPSILEFQKRTGKLPEGLIHSFAALIRFYKGEYNGQALPVQDTPEVLNHFNTQWAGGNSDEVVHATLSRTDFWGMDLMRVPGLAEAIQKELQKF